MQNLSKPDVPKKRTTLYATETSLATFQEICRREGTNMSTKLEQFITQYNQAHKPGNPQLQISNYTKPEEQQPMRVMCTFIKGALTDGRVFCRMADMWIPGVKCYSCSKNTLRVGAK